MRGFKISIEFFGVFMARKDSKYTSTLVVDKNDPKMVGNVIVPERIAIVEKA